MQTPATGFYYHYKHDPALGFNNYAYEVFDLARHSDESYCVAYRPLYESEYLKPASFFVRPLDMFMENVIVDGVSVPRFSKIEDLEVVFKLNEIKKKMYGGA